MATNYNHITAIIFDMDGTLIEHTWQLSQITESLFGEFADQLTDITHDQFFETYWTKSVDMWHMMADQVIDGSTAAKYSYVNTLRTLNQDATLAEAMLASWDTLVLGEIMPFEDTFTVLETLRQKYTTGILTNGFTSLQRAKLARFNFSDYVDFTLVSEEAGYHKPDKRVFDKALAHLEDRVLDPKKTIYVGDNLIADIQGATEAGLTPIFMNPKDDLTPPEGVIKIKRLSELLPLFS